MIHPRQVLYTFGQDIQAVELAGVGARDRAYGFIATLRDFFGASGCIIECGTFDFRVAPEEPAALRKPLRVAQHFFQVRKLCPGECAQAVRNLQLDFAHDGVTPFVQQIVVVVDGTRGGVLYGDCSAVHGAGFDALENLFERVHRDDLDVVSEQVVGGAFAIGPATALKCDFLHNAKCSKWRVDSKKAPRHSSRDFYILVWVLRLRATHFAQDDTWVNYSLMLQGLAFQISSAYCLMVRSELNLPMRATLRMAFSAQVFLFWYSFATLACMST